MLTYRFLLCLLGPLLLAGLVWRVLRGKESFADLRERLGGGQPSGLGAPLWLHGASNGELTSARLLVRDLLERRPGTTVLITCNSLTAREMVKGWALPGVTARLAPLDFRWVLNRFLNRHTPSALLIIENEFWPNRIALCADRGLPVLIAGGRISAGSARNWRRLGGLGARITGAISHLSPQDPASADRFAALGLAPERIGPVLNLKALQQPVIPSAEIARLAPAFPQGRTLLAASTHEGEEEIVIAAFRALLREDPRWRLILAPRHPRRSAEVEQLLTAAGLGFLRRTAGSLPGAEHPVMLADTLGEMPLWYGLASMAFIGGSLVPRGGHTPFEPAAQQVPILTGPHVENAAPAYEALLATGGARTVQSAAELASAARDLTDPAARDASIRAADAVVEQMAGAPARAALLARIVQALPRTQSPPPHRNA